MAYALQLRVRSPGLSTIASYLIRRKFKKALRHRSSEDYDPKT